MKTTKMIEEIELKIRANRDATRDAQRDLQGLEAAVGQLAGQSRHALHERISDTQGRLEALVAKQQRFEQCLEAVLTLQDHCGQAAYWASQVDDFNRRHAAEVSAAEAKITELEDLLATERQKWFANKGSRAEIDKIKARIATQQGILEDLTHEAGVPAMIDDQRRQQEKYAEAVGQAAEAVDRMDIRDGVDAEIETALHAALMILNAAGRKLSRSETFRPQG